MTMTIFKLTPQIIMSYFLWQSVFLEWLDHVFLIDKYWNLQDYQEKWNISGPTKVSDAIPETTLSLTCS